MVRGKGGKAFSKIHLFHCEGFKRVIPIARKFLEIAENGPKVCEEFCLRHLDGIQYVCYSVGVGDMLGRISYIFACFLNTGLSNDLQDSLPDTGHGDPCEVLYRRSENTSSWLIISMFSVRR